MKLLDSTIRRAEREGGGGGQKHWPRKRVAREIVKAAFIYFDSFHTPLISTATGCCCKIIHLVPDRPCTIGRSHQSCDYVLEDRRVSKQHCQILFDGFHRKIFILDGGRFRTKGDVHFNLDKLEEMAVRPSLNGIFLNGFKIGKDTLKELSAGDEVSFVCQNERLAGFLIQRVVFTEEALEGRGEAASSAPLNPSPTSESDDLITITRRANFYLGQCRCILNSDDPISYIRGFVTSYSEIQGLCSCSSRLNNFPSFLLSTDAKLSPVLKGIPWPSQGLQNVESSENIRANRLQLNSIFLNRQSVLVSELNPSPTCVPVPRYQLYQLDHAGFPHADVIASAKPKTLSSNSMGKENDQQFHGVMHNKTWGTSCPPPGKKFYLNRLEFMNYSSSGNHTVISLPELLFPVENLSRIFVATFTSDVLWFLSYCKVPGHLPVTIACHHTERCWSSSADKRAYVPYSHYPNLVIVHPPFPEAIAFGRDRKKLGVACHHPKLLVLQREDSIRIIITSANLVAKQWNSVTNTVWWQDFPRISPPDYSSIFTQFCDGEINLDSRSDFAAQLAGFMASLVIDVPSQAHWIMELTKYDFKGATGHLVASVPGIHFHRTPHASKSMQFLHANQNASCSFGMKFLGSIEASIVGLSHLFHTAADANGAHLKKLAAFLGKCHKNEYGMSEIVLRRNSNIPADSNAVSILVPEPVEHSEGDCIQLGFLPRDVAKWVSPLWDSGFFRFSGYVCPREALAVALGGKTHKVQLILYVSQGASFSYILKMMQPEHHSAICSLVASLKRCVGLWRLQEILGGYQWPESQETDFIYGSSSIGSSINAQFLAAFSAAAGKRSLQFFESDESDPEWGCWSASQESRSPSIKIVFPTIERVKNSSCGILPSRRILCFSEKTWQRLKNVSTIHDAIPHPSDRVKHPMHVKVAQRRFQSKMDSSSFGWVYCGSHNFSAAAWGRPISNPFGIKTTGTHKADSCFDQRLHICNYELGIIFIFPPSATKGNGNQSSTNLDDVVLPFVMPAPKYGPRDRPATTQAMTEALAELTEQEHEKLVAATNTEEMIEEELPDEEEAVEVTDHVAEEKEEEKAYAELLWSQVDSSQSC